jgi:hypothetical protein
MSTKADQQHAKDFVETCTKEQLAKLVAFAINDMPCVETAARSLMKVIIALVKP